MLDFYDEIRNINTPPRWDVSPKQVPPPHYSILLGWPDIYLARAAEIQVSRPRTEHRNDKRPHKRFSLNSRCFKIDSLFIDLTPSQGSNLLVPTH